MIIYSFCVFNYILSLNIQKSNVLRILSDLFLPCYAIHMFVIAAVKKLNLIESFGMFCTWIDYILVVLLTISISYVIMRIPYIKQIFRI